MVRSDRSDAVISPTAYIVGETGVELNRITIQTKKAEATKVVKGGGRERVSCSFCWPDRLGASSRCCLFERGMLGAKPTLFQALASGCWLGAVFGPADTLCFIVRLSGGVAGRVFYMCRGMED